LTESDAPGRYVSLANPRSPATADLNFILLYVEDVAASEAFYAKVFGRPALDSSPTFAMIPAAPGVMLGLWRRDGVAPAPGAPGGGEIAITAKSEADVAVTIARWQALGAHIAQPPTQMDFGFTGVALDPGGHRLRVFCPAERGARTRRRARLVDPVKRRRAARQVRSARA
jgi:predicted enzyme related to lactoylglutathione lyase